MRISDWSSDVCSSDLHHLAVLGDGIGTFQHLHHHRAGGHEAAEVVEEGPRLVHRVEAFGLLAGHVDALAGDDAERSEERRVGKECVRTCSSRWSPYHYTKKDHTHITY